MDLSKIQYNRTFSIVSGFIFGLIFISLFNVAGLNPAKYIGSFYSPSFFILSNLTAFITSLTLLSLTIIGAGVVTSYLSKGNKSCIFGGITGMWLIFMTMIISYIFGVVNFPITAQIEAIIGFTGVNIVFISYTVPFIMVGFILGYFGSFLTEQFSRSKAAV